MQIFSEINRVERPMLCCWIKSELIICCDVRCVDIPHFKVYFLQSFDRTSCKTFSANKIKLWSADRWSVKRKLGAVLKRTATMWFLEKLSFCGLRRPFVNKFLFLEFLRLRADVWWRTQEILEDKYVSNSKHSIVWYFCYDAMFNMHQLWGWFWNHRHSFFTARSFPTPLPQKLYLWKMIRFWNFR